MMSKYKIDRAEKHKVKHIFSGKTHIFEVTSVKETYDVIIAAKCNCEYMGIQGVANSKICSHILAVLKDIAERGDIVESETRQDK